MTDASEKAGLDAQGKQQTLLGDASRKTTDNIYEWVVMSFLVSFVIIVAGVFLYDIMHNSVDHMMTVFTAIVAFLGGLFSPSPMNKNDRTR